MSKVTIDKEKNTYLMTKLNASTKDLLYKKDFIDIKSLLNKYGNDLIYLGDENYKGRNCLKIRAGENTEYLIDEENRLCA